jgi:tetratricopeptide (TPR) repeat protein
MAERIDRNDVDAAGDAGASVASSSDSGIAAGVAMALGKVRPGSKLPSEAAEFLKEQTDLIRIQKEHLHEQRQVILSRLRLGRWKDRVTLGLQALTALVGLAIAAAVVILAWQAHEDHGVTIEAFTVPPDLAQRGLTGQVVASRLLGRLADLQAKTASSRPASSYANDWGDDIKVEIPETGVSIGELSRYLRNWLGSETRITGDVVRTSTGIAVTAQAGASAGSTFEGSDADLTRLIQQMAEAIYQQTQPYRYAAYLASEGKADEAMAAYIRLADDSDAATSDRAWAYLGWATLLFQRNDPRSALAPVSEAIQLDPKIDSAYAIRQNVNYELGRWEAALADLRTELRVLESGRAEGFSPQAARAKDDFVRNALLSQDKGDYALAVAAVERLPLTLSLEGGGSFASRDLLVEMLARDHDVSGALRQLPVGSSPILEARLDDAVALDDWQTALNLIDQQPASYRSEPLVQADQASFLAHLGRIDQARAVVAPTPLDCIACLVSRGEIAAHAGGRTAADRWFSEAVRQAPSPLNYLPWGRSLLMLGDPDAAIVALKQAHRLGPHFADPLEVWGEALMAKRDDAGAISKFTEADKDAPKWGRDHLRWGEALMLSGRYAEARAQYQIANGLDLSVGDRAALNVLLARTATGPLHG